MLRAERTVIMIERFAEAQCTLARLRASAGAEHLDGFAETLFSAGYSRRSGIRYVNGAAHLGNWCRRAGVAIERIDEEILGQFLDHLPRCRCRRSTRDRRRDSRAAVAHFLEYLRRCGVAAPATDCVRRTTIVDAFCVWMRGYRGVTDGTLGVYAPLVREFVECEGERPEEYDASGVRAFVLRRARRSGTDRGRAVVTALRMFLRFSCATGRCLPALIEAVPTIASWRLAKLPRYISAVDVERVIAACDTARPKGARDRAMVLLMARLGLRSGEVATLRLQDLDWTRGRLHVVGKGGAESSLPLPQDVGDAILRYVEAVRPAAPHQYVFVRMVPPWRRLRGVSVSDAVAAAMQAAGVEGRFRGGHMLRHSLATNLLRDGASLEQIGALLRHRSTTTTEIYAKVDVATLRRMAQPWPALEISPC
jgi:integrase/recombinase XerD